MTDEQIAAANFLYGEPQVTREQLIERLQDATKRLWEAEALATVIRTKLVEHEAMAKSLQHVTRRLEQCEAALRKARILLISEGDHDEDGEMIAEIDALLRDAARADQEGK